MLEICGFDGHFKTPSNNERYAKHIGADFQHPFYSSTSVGVRTIWMKHRELLIVKRIR